MGDDKRIILCLDYARGKDESNFEFNTDGQWHNVQKRPQSTASKVAKAAGKSALSGAGRALYLILLSNGKGNSTSTQVSKFETKRAEAHVTEVVKLKILSAGACARFLHASASASWTYVGAKASAKAYLAEAEAFVAIVEDVLHANARAVCGEASADADAGGIHFGVHAGAAVTTAKVEAGISNTPLQASAQGPGAEAEAGFSLIYTGVSAGAYLAEARAGPFAARAGVKFGVGIRYGLPELDLGPVTTPCSVM